MTLMHLLDFQFWDMQEDPTRKVKLLWADRSGLGCTQCSSQLGHTPDQNSTFLTGDTHITSLWYSFSNTGNQGITINAKSSISKFWFQIDEGSNRLIENQGGVGFVIQDVVMLAVSSCKTTTGLKIDIAVGAKHFQSFWLVLTRDFLYTRSAEVLSPLAYSLKSTISIVDYRLSGPSMFQVPRPTLCSTTTTSGLFKLTAPHRVGI